MSKSAPIMRYMTMAWWSGDVPRESADAYSAHFEVIRDRLPANLRDFHERVTLHDSRITRCDIDFEKCQLVLGLAGYAWQPGKLPDRTCQRTLTYAGVRSVRSTVQPDSGFGGPSGFGDLGYDELDVTDDGLVVHRFIFSTAIEVEVTFAELEVEQAMSELDET